MFRIPLLLLSCARPGPPPSAAAPATAPSSAGGASSVISMSTGESAPLRAPTGRPGGAAWLSPAPAPAGPGPLASWPLGAYMDPMGWGAGNLAISDDGALIASGGIDGRLRLFDASSGALLAALPGHEEGITQVRFVGPRALLTGDAVGELRTWDLDVARAEDVRSRALPVQHASPIVALAASADGVLAYSADARGNQATWDLPAGALLRALGGEESTGDGVLVSGEDGGGAAFSPDGRALALHAGGRGFVVLDPRTGERLGGGRWAFGELPVAGQLAWVGAGRLRLRHALLEDDYGPILITDWSLDGQRLEERDLGWVDGGAVTMDPLGQRVAVMRYDAPLSLWSLSELVEQPLDLGPLDDGWRMGFSRDGAHLALGGGRAALNVVEPATLSAAHAGLAGPPGFLHPVALSGDTAALSDRERLRIWPLEGEPASFALAPEAMAFTHGGQRIAALSDGAWSLELDSGALMFEHLGELGYVTGTDLDASADGALIVLGEYDGHLSLLDGETGALRGRVETDDGELYSLRVRADGAAAASTGSAGFLRVRSLPDGALTLDLRLDEGSEIVGWGGGLIAVSGEDTVQLFEEQGGARVFVSEEAVVWSACALTEDGRWLAWGDEAGALHLRRTEDGALWRLPGEGAPAQSMAFDPKGERLLVSRPGGVAEIWALSALLKVGEVESIEVSEILEPPRQRALRVPSGELLPPGALARLPPLHDISVSPDGATLRGIDDAGQVRRVSLPKGASAGQRQVDDAYAELWPLPDGRLVLRDAGLVLMSDTLKPLKTWPDPGGVIAVSPDATRVAQAESGSVRVLDLDGEVRIERARAYADYPNVLAWSPNGELIALGGTDLIVRVWRAADLEPVAAFRAMAEVRQLSFIDDHSVAWTADAGSGEPALAVGRWSGEPERLVLHRGWELGQSFAVHGRTLAVADDAGVRFYDLDAGAQVARLPTPSRVSELAFAPDGRTLVTTHWDEGALLWEVSWLP